MLRGRVLISVNVGVGQVMMFHLFA